jgi:hypothetical protein
MDSAAIPADTGGLIGRIPDILSFGAVLAEERSAP